MKDENEIIECDECGNKLIKDFIRNETYCIECGLVYNPGHPMGRGLSGLISYMQSRGLQDYVESILHINSTYGLTKARLEVARLS